MRGALCIAALLSGVVACSGEIEGDPGDGSQDARVSDASATMDATVSDGSVTVDARVGMDASIKDAAVDATIKDATVDAMMDATVVTGEPAGLVGITAAHNVTRANVSPVPATALPALTWSNTVATAAQTWANNCEWEHGGPGGYGQNLFATTSGASGQGATNSWSNESAHYNYSANTCAAGEVCGHYTQVVWRSSTQLGCGIATCPESTSPFYPDFKGTWQLVVCNYSPPGNNGNRPY